MRKILLMGILLGIFFLAGCTGKEGANQVTQCEIDSDCEYVWYTGGCTTPESVQEVMKKCQDGSGPCPTEAPMREGVTCTCENKECITHG